MDRRLRSRWVLRGLTHPFGPPNRDARLPGVFGFSPRASRDSLPLLKYLIVDCCTYGGALMWIIVLPPSCLALQRLFVRLKLLPLLFVPLCSIRQVVEPSIDDLTQ